VELLGDVLPGDPRSHEVVIEIEPDRETHSLTVVPRERSLDTTS
jgi:hypothetical protein